jgi:hypothetical protein
MRPRDRHRVRQALPADMHVFLVPGLMTNADSNHRRGEIFRHLVKPLGKRGTVSKHDTRKSIKAVHDEVHDQMVEATENYSRPISIYAFSQGATLAANVLMRSPRLREHIQRFVALNGPFWGSEVARRIMQQGRTRLLALSPDTSWRTRTVFAESRRWLTGAYHQLRFYRNRAYVRYMHNVSWDAIRELAPQLRKRYMRKYTQEFLQLTQEIPTLSVSSDGDKLVRPKATYIPGARHLRFGEGIDHYDLVMEDSSYGPVWQWNRMVDFLTMPLEWQAAPDTVRAAP